MSAHSLENSYYNVLEVGMSASSQEIEDSYHRIISYLDPNALAVYSLLSNDEISEKRAQLDEAYHTLTDPELRAAYDKSREVSEEYPHVLVPATKSDSTMSVGMVQNREVEPSPLINIETIFNKGSQEYESKSTPPNKTGRETTKFYETAATKSIKNKVRQPIESIKAGSKRKKEEIPENNTKEAKHEGNRRLYPSLDIEITADTEFSGSLLRRLRESCNASIDDIAQITKIRKHYIEAIEEHAFDSLPASVYVRGFVSEYARILGLDMQRVAKSYMTLYRRYYGEGT
ncbi:MAG: helix-turn-helix domain-containing protein [Deltaproteobacteria bacterium]|nr:helix-turn-helix domain-containing protein [Deltaproteobacteria bacterium]